MDVHYKRIALWGRILGVLMMLTLPLSLIGGILFIFTLKSVVFGFIIFTSYVLLGAGSAWVGKNLYDAGTHAKTYMTSGDEDDADNVIEKYGNFLFANVIFTVVSLVVITPLFVVAIAMGIANIGA